MATNFREVRMEIYLNGKFYCSHSCWVPDEEGVKLEFQITGAIYDLIGTDQSAQIHLELQAKTDDDISVSHCALEGNVVKVVSDTTNTTSVHECEKKEKQLGIDIKNIVSELVCEGLTDPAGPSTKGMDASLEATENCPTESTNGWMNTIGTFFKRLFWSEPETELDESSVPGPSSSEPLGQEVDDDDAILVSEDLQMDASPETPEENSPKKSTTGWMMNIIGAFLRDPAVPESLCIPDASTPEQTSETDLVPSVLEMEPEFDQADPEESCVLVSSVPEMEPEFDQADPEESCVLVSSVPEMEPEFDQADPEESCVPVPSAPEMEPEFDQADPEESCVLVSSIPEMEPEFDQADPEESCVPVPSVPEMEPEFDQADPEESCVPVPSFPEMEPDLDLAGPEQSCVPGPSSAVPKPNARTSKQDPFPEEECFQLYRRVKACTKSYNPVTQVWKNIFIGNEETARDRKRMKELGITHILNAAAMKKKLRILLGIRWEKDIKDTVDTGASYYRGTKIRYCGLPTTKTSDISKYFMPAAKFIHEARKNSKNNVFIHCTDGVNYAPTLFLAYLMIHLFMTVEEAINCLVRVKYIKPDIEFLRQLAILNKKLARK
ncbi:hypothetical protein ABG768_010297 [Culter alburnus]|uniref:Uncharacterized protein n=2 Tax=Culter alburnus TaxID=194366 RepID=A0AAW1ZGY5_CULAL